MTNAVFYSVSPFGTGTIETGDGTITITSGVATLSVAQSGNLGAGVCIEYNSLKCWIAPNRIAFTSGGTTELLTGTKIEGGTSEATGIVRAIEVTSGTWAGGDAAGWIYFESTTGTWNSSEQINRTKPTDSSNIATTNGSIEGNIGNGNTEFVVKSATGGAAANQTATSVTSVHHEWAALADFESQFTDGSHINNTSLVSADVVAYACCYYDHANPTTNPDDTVVGINFGTTGLSNYLQIYTPVGGAESINSQRHDGSWDTSKYRLDTTTTETYSIYNQENNVRVEGIAAKSYTGKTAIRNSINAGEVWYINNVLTINTGVSYDSGIATTTGEDDGGNVKLCIFNNIIYGFSVGTSNQGLQLQDDGVDETVEVYIYYNTISDGYHGVRNLLDSVGHVDELKNNAIFNNVDDIEGTCSPVEYNAGDDSNFASGTGNIQWTGGATDWGNVFTDYANDDFSLKDFSGTGAIIEQGTPLLTEGVWRDIIGTERDTTSPDIGAFEYVSAGPSISIPVIMHHYRQQRL